MNRRDFLSSAGAALAASQLGCAPAVRTVGDVGASVAGMSGRRLKTVGIQLYSLRDDARRDLESTLGQIAGMGYKTIEMLGSMNNFGMPVPRLRQILDRNGLRAVSTHVGGNALDDLDKTLDEAAALGHEYVIVASLPIQGQRTLDDYRRWADRFNEAGRQARTRNIWIGFHNHANDHAPIDGTVPYDLMMDRTDASITRMQLDTGNTAMASRDPMEYMRKYGPRYWSFHIKDVPALGAKSDTELGKGTIDFRRLFAMIENIDQKHMFVEQETYPGTPADSLRRDYQYISALEF
jgi:sugar phosphate isomerase/epimerase